MSEADHIGFSTIFGKNVLLCNKCRDRLNDSLYIFGEYVDERFEENVSVDDIEIGCAICRNTNSAIDLDFSDRKSVFPLNLLSNTNGFSRKTKKKERISDLTEIVPA